jgi:hypothetical protein
VATDLARAVRPRVGYPDRGITLIDYNETTIRQLENCIDPSEGVIKLSPQLPTTHESRILAGSRRPHTVESKRETNPARVHTDRAHQQTPQVPTKSYVSRHRSPQ